MNNEKRQSQLDALMKDKYLIEGALDFKDCVSVYDVIDATCKLLVDNFDVAMDGTYIKEIIEQACYESMDRDNEFDK